MPVKDTEQLNDHIDERNRQLAVYRGDILGEIVDEDPGVYRRQTSVWGFYHSSERTFMKVRTTAADNGMDHSDSRSVRGGATSYGGILGSLDAFCFFNQTTPPSPILMK